MGTKQTTMKLQNGNNQHKKILRPTTRQHGTKNDNINTTQNNTLILYFEKEKERPWWQDAK